MNETRIIFSPHTADPKFVAGVAAAMAAAPLNMAQVLWQAQFELLRVVLTAQFNFMDSVSRATLRAR